MTKTKKRILVAVACVSVIAVSAISIGAANAGGKDNPEAPVDERMLVEVAAPAQRDIAVEGEFIGTVDPNQQVTVFPKAAGEVLEVLHDVGDYVEAGTVLAVLDSKSLELSIEQTKAAVANQKAKADYNLAMAQNDLEVQDYNADHGYNSSLNGAETDIERQEAAVVNAKAAVETAEQGLREANVNQNTARSALEYLREDTDVDANYPDEDLYDLDVAKARDQLRLANIGYDRAELALADAKRALETAETDLETAKKNAKTAEITELEKRNKTNDAVEMARLNADFTDQYINIQKLEQDLADYTVKAAISGVIETRAVDPYDMASPQGAMFTISNKDAMIISFNVSETAVMNMRMGDPVKIDKNGTESVGTITEIASAVDAQSGLFKVKATVTNPPTALLSGSTVKVFAETQKAPRSLTVPIDVVYYDGGAPYVFVAKDGQAKKVFIETGISSESEIQVISGLTIDDALIVNWSSGMVDGMGIKLSADEPMPEPAPQETSGSDPSKPASSTAAGA